MGLLSRKVQWVLVTLLAAGSCAHASPSDEWGMYQRDAVHDGYAPDTLLLNRISFAWSEHAQSTAQPVRGIAASRDTAFTTGISTGSDKALVAQSLVDGHTLWSVPFTASGTISEPAYSDGTVWLVECNYDNFNQVVAAYLDAFDAVTGAPIFHIAVNVTTISTEAPTIANGHVYFVSPMPFAPSGVFGSVSAATGQIDWMSQSPGGDGQTASVLNGVIYGYTTTLNELDPATGLTTASIPNPNNSFLLTTGRAPVFSNNTAFMTQGGKVAAFDTLSQAYAWSVDTYAQGQVSTDGHDIFYLSSGALSVHDAATGALEWGWEAPQPGPGMGGGITDNLVVTKSHVILTDGFKIYFINRATHMQDTSFSVTGVIAYAADTLLVGDVSGIVTAFHLPSDEIFKGDFE